MRYIKSILIVAAMGLAAACSNDPTSVEFGLDTTEIKLGPEGGTKSIRVSADNNWTATTNKTWILVSPANGNASTECRIRIDSTLVDREESGTVTFSIAGQERKIQITRAGFPLQITVPETTQNISIPDYADVDDAYFDVEVSSNVPFTVKIPEEVTWVKPKEFKQTAAVGYRPRTTKIRFLWDINSKPFRQDTKIEFVPQTAVTRQDVVKVVQDAAPEIIPGRAGDSMALLAIGRNLKMWSSSFDPSKSMIYWENVKLWEVTDKNVKKENIGRVKSATFFIFNTKMSLPYEVQYLTAADSLTFYSNENNSTRRIELGSEICELENLRALTIDAYGICKLPADLPRLKNLESLSLNSNTFLQLPLDVVNKQNFPKLRRLSFNYERRKEVYDLSNNIETDIGVGGVLPEELLRWDELIELTLSFNYFEGSIPEMKNYTKYTAEDEAVKKGHTEAGVPKVLPNLKALRINGNRLTGLLPDWILKHPKLFSWDPYIFVFNQEGKDSAGNKAGFPNEPERIEPPTTKD